MNIVLKNKNFNQSKYALILLFSSNRILNDDIK